MRWPNRRNREPGAKRPARMLAWALLARPDVRSGRRRRISRGSPARHPQPHQRAARKRRHRHCRRSMKRRCAQVGRWPWPRGRYAELVDAIERGRAEPAGSSTSCSRSSRTRHRIDKLAEAIERSANVTLAYLPRAGAQDGKYEDVRPLPEFRRARQARHNRRCTTIMPTKAGSCLTACKRGDNIIPSLASVLADRNNGSRCGLPRRITHSILLRFRPTALPTCSPAALAANSLSGKTVDRRPGG